MNYVRLLAYSLLLGLTPNLAWAASTLTCVGPTPRGQLINDTSACVAAMGPQAIFSGLICQYEQVISTVLSYMYCSIQYGLKPLLVVVIAAYVISYGMQISAGLVRLSKHDAILRLFKLGAIWLCATQAQYGIGIIYNFFTGAAQDAVSWVMQVIMTTSSLPSGYVQGSVFQIIDQIVYGILMSPFTGGGSKLFGFIGIMSLVMPSIFMLFFYFFYKLARIFTHGLMTYVLAISAIAFLVALSPVFLSFAFFRSTYNFFDMWLRHLITYSVQILLTFAFLGIWLWIYFQLGNFFGQLGSIIVPYNEVLWLNALRDPINAYGVCPYAVGSTGPYCTGSGVWPATAVLGDSMLITYVTYNLLILLVYAYAFDALIHQVPGMAQQIGGGSAVFHAGAGGAVGYAQRMAETANKKLHHERVAEEREFQLERSHTRKAHAEGEVEEEDTSPLSRFKSQFSNLLGQRKS